MKKDLDYGAYVIQLPEAVQEEIRSKVTSALMKEGVYSKDNVQHAMDSKVIDLEEVIDPEKFAPPFPTFSMEM